MTNNHEVLLIGWHPDVVDYAKWPELSPEILAAGLEGEREALAREGVSAEWLLISDPEAGYRHLVSRLEQQKYQVILIGAGVRIDPDAFHVFERLINIVHEHAPDSRICFNTHPGDTAEAIGRWLEPRSG